MNYLRLLLKTLAVSVLILAPTTYFAEVEAIPSVTSKQIPFCASPEYREFDFWIGDWDAFEPDNASPVAHVPVDIILAGCVLFERYEDPTGLKGESFSIFE